MDECSIGNNTTEACLPGCRLPLRCVRDSNSPGVDDYRAAAKGIPRSACSRFSSSRSTTLQRSHNLGRRSVIPAVSQEPHNGYAVVFTVLFADWREEDLPGITFIDVCRLQAHIGPPLITRRFFKLIPFEKHVRPLPAVAAGLKVGQLLFLLLPGVGCLQTSK